MSGYPDVAIEGLEDAMPDKEILRKPFSLKTLAARARLLLEASNEQPRVLLESLFPMSILLTIQLSGAALFRLLPNAVAFWAIR